MSWLRIEGRMPQHHKVAPLSDAAFRLHITAMAWSVEGKTDGKVPLTIPQTLTRAPSGKKLSAALKELTDFGVWIEKGGAYHIHDFLQWNLSAAEIKAKAESKAKAGAAGGKRSGEARGKQEPSKSEAPASGVLPVAPKLGEPKPKPLPKSLSLSEGEDAEASAAERSPMALDWSPTLQTIAGIELAGVAGWAVPELVARFRAHFLADPSEASSAPEWNQRCVKWVIKDWRDPSKRPDKPGTSPAAGDLGEYGKSSEWA